MKARYFIPLAGFVVPTLVIGYGFVIPQSCIAGWNELTLGFAATVGGVHPTLFRDLILLFVPCRRRDSGKTPNFIFGAVSG